MPRRGPLILSGAPRIVSSVSDLETPAAQAPPSVYLKTCPTDHCPIIPPLAAIQRRRCGPIWPRHNGPVSAAANIPRFVADCVRANGFDGIAFKGAPHYFDNLILFNFEPGRI